MRYELDAPANDVIAINLTAVSAELPDDDEEEDEDDDDDDEVIEAEIVDAERRVAVVS
ncbi:MAG TPA: hypothetical protein VFE36_00230 [Candidatus Baltobacteraceae bacterium]|jgi:hypothetical protein|nr:hypothetical protein [Candidatus Baltobacteraceae bacterium]